MSKLELLLKIAREGHTFILLAPSPCQHTIKKADPLTQPDIKQLNGRKGIE